MKLKTITVGIMSKEDYKNRTMAIVKGEYKPKKDDPKIWFESIKSMAQILSNENQELLKVILENVPKSLKELEKLTGRAKSNLSRTLKTLKNENKDLKADNLKLMDQIVGMKLLLNNKV